jgi:hypothetical protein
MVSGTSFIIKKIKEQGFLRKSHQKHTLWIWDLRSGIRKNLSQIKIPDPGGKSTGFRIRNTGLQLGRYGYKKIRKFTLILKWGNLFFCSQLLSKVMAKNPNFLGT